MFIVIRRQPPEQQLQSVCGNLSRFCGFFLWPYLALCSGVVTLDARSMGSFYRVWGVSIGISEKTFTRFLWQLCGNRHAELYWSKYNNLNNSTRWLQIREAMKNTQNAKFCTRQQRGERIYEKDERREWPASTKQRVNKFGPEGLFFWLASPRNISYPIFMTPPPGAISFMVPPGSQILNSFSQFRMVLTGHTINTRVTCHIIEINKMFVLDRILRQSSSPDWRLLPNRTSDTFHIILLSSFFETQ